ncbi:unnamed protein product [Moneuplotes crassus]|uniref:Uncharacterized protein n=1 Tax=Euplotes crassus TaxID=5936 RepID=A0AAD1XLV3_EUPCR|nr:unnamed protein product [Moneuplotes crassus]
MKKAVWTLCLVCLVIGGKQEGEIECLTNDGFELYQICKKSMKSCEEEFKKYFNHTDEYGWMPTCESISLGNIKKTSKNLEDLCEIPTFLLSINYILTLENQENLLKYLWEPLQLRYKHCYRLNSNFHLEGGYRFTKDTPIEFDDYYMTSLEMNCWMAEYSRILQSVSDYFTKRDIQVRRLKGFEYDFHHLLTKEAISKFNYDQNLKVFTSLLGYQPVNNTQCDIKDPECLEMTPYRLTFQGIRYESLCPYIFNLTDEKMDLELLEYITIQALPSSYLPYLETYISNHYPNTPIQVQLIKEITKRHS